MKIKIHVQAAVRTPPERSSTLIDKIKESCQSSSLATDPFVYRALEDPYASHITLVFFCLNAEAHCLSTLEVF